MSDIKKATKSLQKYMNSYDQQCGYEDYLDMTFIDDVIYGLGIALDDKKYRFTGGFDRFKAKLVKHLTGEEFWV